MQIRCSICGNWDWLDRAPGEGGARECSHCRLVVDGADRLDRVRAEIAARLARGIVDLAAEPGDGWSLDMAGMRNAAWHFAYEVEPLAPQALRFPADGTPARARATPAQPKPHDVTLAVMTRPRDAAALIALFETLRETFPNACAVIDGTASDAAPIARALPWANVTAHPLEGDFATQRNRLQAMSETRWVLQIDTDERPDARFCAAIGWLVAAADRDGLRSLGIPRRNIVDGAHSALYPDIQYRLNRADIRFAGTVHERPVVAFDESSLALCGALEHDLNGARVRERTRIYEAMAKGGGRPQDEALLLEPFDPVAIR